MPDGNRPKNIIIYYIIGQTVIKVWQIKCLYVKILFAGKEKYPRGRRGGFAKALGGATRARVRLPPSPPNFINGVVEPNKIRGLRV